MESFSCPLSGMPRYMLVSPAQHGVGSQVLEDVHGYFVVELKVILWTTACPGRKEGRTAELLDDDGDHLTAGQSLWLFS